ncbi:MAG: amidohydrolase, partial [Longimicrobiales bacterium]
GTSPGGWVCGRGWSRERWAGAEPQRAALDALLPDTPVALQSQDMHALWVNTAALRVAGIGADTPDPPGGRIVRDADGEPTGLLLENAGQIVIRQLPAPAEAEMLDAVLDAQAQLHRLGITGVHSLPGIAMPRPDPLSVLETLRAQGRLRLRVLQHLPLERLDDAIRLGLRSGFGGDWVRIGGVKMFLDGSLGSRTAWMREPYIEASVARCGWAPHSTRPIPFADLGRLRRPRLRVAGSADGGSSTDCGVNVLPESEFRSAVRRAAEAGLASTVHAIGDAAVALAIDVLSDPAVHVAAMPHRIEHVQCLPYDGLEALERPPHPDPLPHVGDRAYAALEGPPHMDAHADVGDRAYSAFPARGGRAGIVCSVQPAHLITDWCAVDRYWGPARGARTYAFRTLLEAGAVIACGSDAPVEPVDPRLGLFAAVVRTDLEHNPAGGWHPAQRIVIEDAFRGYTIGAALAAGLPAENGALTRGAFADIVAWNADPLAEDVDPLALECIATIVGGERVYVR